MNCNLNTISRKRSKNKIYIILISQDDFSENTKEANITEDESRYTVLFLIISETFFSNFPLLTIKKVVHVLSLKSLSAGKMIFLLYRI